MTREEVSAMISRQVMTRHLGARLDQRFQQCIAFSPSRSC